MVPAPSHLFQVGRAFFFLEQGTLSGREALANLLLPSERERRGYFSSLAPQLITRPLTTIDSRRVDSCQPHDSISQHTNDMAMPTDCERNFGNAAHEFIPPRYARLDLRGPIRDKELVSFPRLNINPTPDPPVGSRQISASYHNLILRRLTHFARAVITIATRPAHDDSDCFHRRFRD